MSLSIPVPHKLVKDEKALSQLLSEIIRRAVDGSASPVQINVQLNVNGNDIKIKNGGSGLILASRDGLHYGRLLLENPDPNGNLVISVDTLS